MAEPAPVVDPVSDSPEDPLTTRSRYLTLNELNLVAQLRHAGRTVPDIALALHRSTSTISEALQRLQTTPDLVRALLAASSVQQVATWRKASRKAATRGDHRPAKEWIEMAHPELRPVTSATSGGGGVTIIIGVPGAPLSLPDITVHASTPALSPPSPLLESTPEGETKPNP